MHLERREIFKRFIGFLADRTIPYGVLGNIKNYPQTIHSDVDIVLPKHVFKNVHILVADFLRENNLVLYNILTHEISAKYFVIGSKEVENSMQSMAFLALDFASDYRRNSRLLIPSDILLKDAQTIIKNGFSFNIPSNPISFIYYLIKRSEKDVLDIEQFEYLHSLWNNDKESIKIIMPNYLDYQICEAVNEVFETGDPKGINNLLKLVGDYTKKEYKTSIKDKIQEFGRKLRRFVRPTGLMIAFMGCDGSGKSTLINGLISSMPDFLIFRNYAYHHLYPKHGSIQKNVPNPHEQPLRGKWMSNLKLLVMLYRYLWGYIRYVYPQLVRSHLVIFDRYYYDLGVDSVRYRHGGSKWLTKLVGKLVPKPSITFVVDVSPKIIQTRKQEVPFEETVRQSRAYKELKHSYSNVVLIDNEKPIEEGVIKIQQEICIVYERRFKFYE